MKIFESQDISISKEQNLGSLDHQNSEPMIKLRIHRNKFYNKSSKFSTDSSTKKNMPVVMEKYELENRDRLKIDTLFGTFLRFRKAFE